MVNRPSTPEIITVNSEALQTQIRDLLPSQNGFGSELQASNVITPIVDLTATAEGSGLPYNLQTALAFGSQTTFSAENSTASLANSPGFWRLTGVSNVEQPGASTHTSKIDITDGLSTKFLWRHIMSPGTANNGTSLYFDLIVFLRAGDSLSASSSSTGGNISGSYRQVATGDGTLVQPNGYPL